jgi:23S rRNA (adenine2503-C2)-methyltransferase
MGIQKIMDQMSNLARFSRSELEALFAEWGQPRFRVTQLLRWIWKEGVTDFDKMTNLSRDLRERLSQGYTVAFPKPVYNQASEDGTVKYIMRMDDGKTVETVWIPREDQERVTICVSSQIGCKMGCTFCLTAQQKIERNLTAGEIAGQLMALPNREKITNVVLMGMGEPLDNYDNVMGALDLMTDEQGLHIGPRRITVSTSGLVPAIRRFLNETRARLAVSLNGPNDAIRTQLMPINKAYNIDLLLSTLREISKVEVAKPGGSKFLITFEYILIKDINDQPEHARELAKRVRGIPCKINLLLYNENPNVPYKRPDMESVELFRRTLTDHRVLNFVRSSRGRDISAACGQLISEHRRGARQAS